MQHSTRQSLCASPATGLQVGAACAAGRTRAGHQITHQKALDEVQSQGAQPLGILHLLVLDQPQGLSGGRLQAGAAKE